MVKKRVPRVMSKPEILKKGGVNVPGHGSNIVRLGAWDRCAKRKVSTADDNIDGKNTEHAADVERAEVVFGAPGVEQNAADQKAGEDEEQVHAAPSMDSTPGEEAQQRVRPVGDRVHDIVQVEDKEDGHASDAVEFRYTRFHER